MKINVRTNIKICSPVIRVHGSLEKRETLRGRRTTGCLGRLILSIARRINIVLAPWHGKRELKRGSRFHCNKNTRASISNSNCKNRTKNQHSPVCRPLRLASLRVCTRARLCTTAGFLIIKPSRCNLAMLRRELAKAISLTSLGSNQILRFPHLRTEAAKRFWSRRETEKIK